VNFGKWKNLKIFYFITDTFSKLCNFGHISRLTVEVYTSNHVVKFAVPLAVQNRVTVNFIFVLFPTFLSFLSPSLFCLLFHSRCRGFLFSVEHTQTHTKFGRTPLDEVSSRRRDLYVTKQTLTRDKHLCPWWDLNQRLHQTLCRRPTP
jgi:hypothetical protein